MDILFWLLVILIAVVTVWFAQLPPRDVSNILLQENEHRQSQESDASTNPLDGFLEITSTPEADTLFVDTIKFSRGTPHAGTFPPGEHRIRCIFVALNRTWESTVTLEPGERKTVHIVLD